MMQLITTNLKNAPWWLKPLAPAITVFTMTMALTLMSTAGARREVRDRAQSQFQAIALGFQDVLLDRIRIWQQSLSAGAAFLRVVPNPTREQWDTYALNTGLQYRVIRGLGYARYLTGTYEDFERQERALGRPEFRVRPAGKRDAYTIIQHLSPENEPNISAIGFDMMSEPVRRKAIEAARDSGRPMMSGRVKLVQDADTDGVLIYFAVSNASAIARPPSPQVPVGFIYAPVRISSLIEVTKEQLQSEQRAFNLRLSDVTDASVTTLYNDTDQTADQRSSVSIPVEVYGRKWVATLTPNAMFWARHDAQAPWRTFAIGSVISLLVGALAAMLGLRQHAATENAAALEAEVKRRAATEASLRLSNRELIHRVKNTLAIVTSISTQTARHSSSMSEFQSAFRQRVNALGRVHDMLRAEHAFTPVFGDLVLQTLSPYVSSERHALHVEGPPVVVSQDQAVMYALLLNELGTNATKHGAWSKRGGRVDVNWSFDQGGEKLFVIKWRERGGPPVVEPSRKGFGSALTTFAVERTLKGRLTTDYQSTGVAITIELPWTEATAAEAGGNWKGLPDMQQ